MTALHLFEKCKTSMNLPDCAAGLLVRWPVKGHTATTFVVVVPERRSIPAWDISFNLSIAAANAAALFCSTGLSGTVNG